MAYYISRSAAAYQRLIIISDIHGHAAIFDDMIEQLKLTDRDLLVINGDMVNRGNDSLAVLRRVMQLTESKNVVVLKGNHESFMQYYLAESREQELKALLSHAWYPNLAQEMVRALGYDSHNLAELDGLTHALRRAYSEELTFIENLPLYLETDHHIVVHAAYQDDYDLATDSQKFLKNDEFVYQTEPQAKTVVVGHWPASNMRADINSNAPYFDLKKNIIAIDGALGVKTTGELVALIIEQAADQQAMHYHYVFANDFAEKTIVKSHIFAEEETFFINYPDFAVTRLSKGERFSLVKHNKSGRRLTVFNCLLTEIDGQLMTKVIYTNRYFNLQVGDKVELCKTFRDCHLVKYGGQFGWILKDQID